MYVGLDSYQPHDKREHDAIISLVDYVQTRVLRVLVRMVKQGHNPYCIEGKRSLARQLMLMATGRSKTRHSKHLVGKAADIVDAKLFWKASDEFKLDLVASTVAEGMVSGYKWKSFGRFGDWCHLEWGG